MVNLIKTGLKSGNTKNCVPSEDIATSEEKLGAFIEQACTKVLDDQENAFELQGGTLDLINRCTQKVEFCGVCCQYEFGAEKLVERNNCDFECSSMVSKLLEKRPAFTADVTNVVQKSAYD